MVDVIARCTVIAVLVLGALNALHGGAVLVRLVRHVSRCQPRHGLDLWMPAFTSPADVRAWLARWRAVLREPALVAVRADARTVIGRHFYLALLSNTWVFAVSAIAPHLA
jgi:hypothetical protein